MTLAPQARQARASDENLNYVTLAPQARPSGEILNYLLSRKSDILVRSLQLFDLVLVKLADNVHNLLFNEHVPRLFTLIQSQGPGCKKYSLAQFCSH